jgi:hypothetical protein
MILSLRGEKLHYLIHLKPLFMRLLTMVLWLLLFSNLFSQLTDIFRIDSLPTEGVLLDKGYKFHTDTIKAKIFQPFFTT